jgi:predicted nucleotidyltransferase component of viral defense system
MITDHAKSIKAKLLNVARKEVLNYQQLVIRYFYERLLYRLSISEFCEDFYLKGGALLYALEKEHARPTLDMDFLGVQISNDMEHIKAVFTKILAIEDKEDGVLFDTSGLTATTLRGNKLYEGIRLSFSARLDSIIQNMKLDIGFGDVVTPHPQIIFYPTLITNLLAPRVFAYSQETIIAEKFHAMVELSETNSRYKDFYDVYKILLNNHIGDESLAAAIHATFQNRNFQYIDKHPLFTKDFSTNENRNTQWKFFLKKINHPNDLTFQTVMNLIVARLQPIYETLNRKQEKQ